MSELEPGQGLRITVLDGALAVCRLPPDAPLPRWAQGGPLLAFTRTRDELSVVCPEACVPGDVRAERGWLCLRVEGPLDLSLTGVVARLGSALARAGVPVFVVSTFDTDYLLVRSPDRDAALRALRADGHEIAG